MDAARVRRRHPCDICMAKFSADQLRSIGLSPDTLPRHVAIIMDGNGRWATSRNMPRSFGHRAGTNRLREIIRLSSDIGIVALSLYAFSTENWKRPKDEVSTLFSLLVEYFSSEIDELDENNVRIRALGDIGSFPERVFQAVRKAETRTEKNSGLQLNIALNYGSYAEITRAANLAMAECRGTDRPITAEQLESHLYTNGLPPLDLLIRTGGEKRLSNFLLYQASYAEIIFTDDFWPDFTDARLIESLREYASRKRRYGGLEQPS